MDWSVTGVIQMFVVVPEIRQVERGRREAEVGCKQSLI